MRVKRFKRISRRKTNNSEEISLKGNSISPTREYRTKPRQARRGRNHAVLRNKPKANKNRVRGE